jgi:hypothetical protein
MKNSYSFFVIKCLKWPGIGAYGLLSLKAHNALLFGIGLA